MNSKNITSFFLFLFGLLFVLVPFYLLPVCAFHEASTAQQMSSFMGHHDEVHHEAHHEVHHERHLTKPSAAKAKPPMKCFWTARMEAGIGAMIMLFALLHFFIASPQVRQGLHLALTGIALLAAAVPTILIGVCGSSMMPCYMGTLPALLILSGALFLFSAVHSYALRASVAQGNPHV